MVSGSQPNPYLVPGRLSNVIAAITALGKYRYYKLDYEQCAERISNRPQDAHLWAKIFSEHPEFFRIVESESKASLVWRRQFIKNFDPKTGLELTRADVDALSAEDRSRLSRRPLNETELKSLIAVAVDLHKQALEEARAKRWWVPILIGALAFLGALVGGLAKGEEAGSRNSVAWWSSSTASHGAVSELDYPARSNRTASSRPKM
ncbi:MAG: hypothetical protein KDK07_19240 [Bauldia sp.]|nr:hypothetical protein [Bauldia sp.]